MNPVTDSAKVTVRLPLQLTLNRDTQICYGAPLTLNAIQYTKLPFWFALGIVMVIVAVSTYLLSHFWAFKGKK